MSKVFKRWLLVNLIVLGSILLMVAVGLILLRRDISRRAQKTIEERNLYTFRSEGVKALSSLREESRISAAYRGELNSALPKEEELFAFTRTADRFAKARNVNLSFAFGLRQPASGDIAPSINFNMGVEGQYANIVRFLEDIEREKILVRFNTIDMARQGNVYSMKISGQLFVRESAS